MATAGDLNVPRGTGHPEPHEKARTTGGHTSTMGVGGSHEGPDVLTSIAGGNKHLSKRESAKAAHDKMENVGEIPPSDEFQHDLSKNFIPQASKQSHRMGVAPCVDEEGADSRVRAQRLEPGDNVARDAMKKLLETGAIGQTIPPARARIASGSNPSTSSSR